VSGRALGSYFRAVLVLARKARPIFPALIMPKLCLTLIPPKPNVLSATWCLASFFFSIAGSRRAYAELLPAIVVVTLLVLAATLDSPRLPLSEQPWTPLFLPAVRLRHLQLGWPGALIF
jgi:hypothetical protein